MAKSSRRRKRDRSKREATAAQKRAAVQRRQAAEEFVRVVTERFDRIVDPGTPPEEVAGLIAEFYDGQPASTGLADRMLADGSSPERLAAVAEIMMAAEPGDAADAGDIPTAGDAGEIGDALGAGDAPGAGDARDAEDTEMGDAPGSEEIGDAGDAGDAGDTAGAADKPSPSVTALTFAASVARAAGDAETARRLLDQALAAADDPDTRVDVIEHLRQAGRVADAIELFEARLREMPDDGHAAGHYGTAMEDAYAHVNEEEPGGACPCGRDASGRGASWQECCGPRERAALSRFTDRSTLTALQDAISAYLAESEYGQAVADEVAESLSLTDDLDWEPAELAAFSDLMSEHVLLTARLSVDDHAEYALGTSDEAKYEGDEYDEDEGDADEGDEYDDEGDEWDEDEGDADTALAAFAASPSLPPGLATRAADWRRHIHYGLWRIDNPRPTPGLWCTDINSGVTRYVEFPAELTDGMPRWAVWLGGVVPVDGIWRSTGHGVRLSPAEADAVAELVHEAVMTLIQDIAGKPMKKRSRLMTEPMRFGRAEPLGVYADLDNQTLPYAAGLFSSVTGGLLSRIVAEVQMYRSAPPQLRDGDEDATGGQPEDATGGQPALPRGAATAAEGWEKHWLDERVPALRGRTPRQAAARDKERPLVEALLRQFEYEADLLAAEGKSGIDTGWLRQELDMDIGLAN